MLMKVDFEYSKRHMFGSPNRSGKSLSDYEYRDGISHNGITCLDRSRNHLKYQFQNRQWSVSREDFGQGPSGRRRPRRPGSLQPSFPSLNSSPMSQFSSIAFKNRLLRYKVGPSGRDWKIPDGEDVDVLRRPDFGVTTGQ